MTRLYIGNVSTKVTPDELKSLFDDCGKIKSFDVKEGSGYMEFETSDEAEEAIKKFNRYDFHGKGLIVEPARKIVPRGGGYRGGRGGGYRNAKDYRRSRSSSRSSSESSESRSTSKKRRYVHSRSHSRSRSRSRSRSSSSSRDKRNHKKKSKKSKLRSTS